jgi:hypothetical protein
MATRMQQRRGTAAQWTGANPILAAGEIGFESDTSKFKIGDGVNHWADLIYYASAEELSSLIDGAPDLLNTLNELAAAVGDDPTFFTTVASNLSAHSSDTTSVHGIANTALLATLTNVDDKIATAATELEGYADSAVTDHNAATTNVHGIADTSVLATSSSVSDAVADAVGSHNSDTTNVHGIADTSALALSADLDTHASDTTSVHGIADTAELVTFAALNDALASAAGDMSAQAGEGIDWNTVTEAFDIDATVATKTYADDAVSTHNSDTSNVHGIADTSLLATTLDVSTAKQEAIDSAAVASENYADGLAANYDVAGAAASAVSTHNSDTTGVHGIADTSKIVLKDATSTTLDGGLVISGNLTVNGTTTTVSAQDLVVSDPLIYIGEGNTANLVDIGVVGNFNDGTYQHSGIVRDASAGKWKIFKGVTDEPTTTVNFSQGSLDNLAVNNVEVAGVVFTDGTQSKEGVPSRTPIIQKTAGYTLSALTERDSLIEMSSSSGITLTIPTDATLNFPIGTSIDILQTSTGQVTIAAATPGTTTVNATPGLKLRTQWSSATLFKRAANTWVVYGDLTA